MIEINVLGEPAPQGSKRHIGNGRMIEASKKVAPWRAAVSEAAALHLLNPEFTPFEGAVIVDIEFYLPKPKTVQRTLPHVRPDLDKLIRSTFDALTKSGVWQDDCQAVTVYAKKLYGTPGARIRISQWG